MIWLYNVYGTWRPAFMITGTLGLVWLIVWRLVYKRPAIQAGHVGAVRQVAGSSWLTLLRRKDTWGIVLGKGLTDPVWFFITDWFAIFLVSKGFRLEIRWQASGFPFSLQTSETSPEAASRATASGAGGRCCELESW